MLFARGQTGNLWRGWYRQRRRHRPQDASDFARIFDAVASRDRFARTFGQRFRCHFTVTQDELRRVIMNVLREGIAYVASRSGTCITVVEREGEALVFDDESFPDGNVLTKPLADLFKIVGTFARPA